MKFRNVGAVVAGIVVAGLFSLTTGFLTTPSTSPAVSPASSVASSNPTALPSPVTETYKGITVTISSNSDGSYQVKADNSTSDPVTLTIVLRDVPSYSLNVPARMGNTATNVDLGMQQPDPYGMAYIVVYDGKTAIANTTV